MITVRKAALVAGPALAVVVGWYLFRPERAFLDRRVSEPPPSPRSVVVFSGRFSPRAHDGRGLAEVLELDDGRRVLRFSQFETLNGPDLQVYLLGSAAVESRRELETAGYVSLGALKGNAGDQNYDIPPGTDLPRYPAVAIWCRRFGVNFTTAVLSAPAGT